MKANDMMKTVNIQGHEYSVDPTNGLPCVGCIVDVYSLQDEEPFEFAVPDGYEVYEAMERPDLISDREDLKWRERVYTVWFGTIEQIVAARTGGKCRFIPAEEEAA